MQRIEPNNEPVSIYASVSSQRLAACSTTRARALVPLELADALGLLPIALVQHNGVTVLAGAVSKGNLIAVEQAIRFKLGIKAKLVEVDTKLLHEGITIAYKSDGVALNSAMLAAKCEAPRDSSEASGKVMWMPTGAGAAQLFSELVEHAAAREASDIFLVPHEEYCEIRFKINGEFHRWNGKPISKALHLQLVRRAKVLARLDPTVTLIAQDGSFEGARGVRARLSALPTIHGENIVIRLISARVRELADLGLCIQTRERLERWISSANGLIVFGGPTGAGKSASLYAALLELSRRGLGVASVEDSVELEIKGVIQSQVSAGGSFSDLVRAVLRQAPDVIALGEVRDSATARALIEAATTGHLVLCSMHGGDLNEILARFAHFGINEQLLSLVLRGVIVQRLVPKLCSACRVVDLTYGGFREVGCQQCQHTGYEGRVLFAESYEHPRLLSDKIIKSAPHLLSWEQSLVEQIQAGLISRKSAAFMRW